MARIFEVTTIVDKVQQYEVFEIKRETLASGAESVQFRDILRDKGSIGLRSLGSRAFQMYDLTGLDDAIKTYPLVLEAPERLRLIYDPFPLSISIPILRIAPVTGEICVCEYQPTKAKLPLERMTFFQEKGGDLHLRFSGLKVYLHFAPDEEEQQDYYGRDLKRSS